MVKPMPRQEIQVQLMRALSEFSEEENERIRKCMRKAALSCRNDLKNTSPKAYGEYASGWRIKKVEKRLECSYTIYNAKKPGLTHLLEKKHLIRNQYGRYGFSTPQVHIAPAKERAEDLLIDLLVSEL